ncbi:hypothetical protein D187_003225 [Cystobacter fuscus DSM 2262]|uniref:Uncharacterized protein n=1 Tax=Cystobacter fuscus (strain ATCC 25194 / DSM 2262 / NBRC 100088 / M29) TaxID=1242864 RepID=S9QRA7_CYSF2|nr:hypothetical protein D187_003225 [Cystobacter fuscus DSM 2262]
MGAPAARGARERRTAVAECGSAVFPDGAPARLEGILPGR